MNTRSREVTQCLEEIGRGDRSAMNRLLPHVYEDLRELAEGLFRGQGVQTLQPTALVHEAYLRLVKSPGAYQDRRHFLRVASMAMRQLLANHAEARRTQKRGAGRTRVVLENNDPAAQESDSEAIDLVALHDALERLAELDERQARVVELRYLAGLTVPEVAEILQVTERTVYMDWRMARAFLETRIAGDPRT